MAAFLVPRIRDVPPKSSTLTGGIQSQYIQFLTKPKAFSQIFSVGWLDGTGVVSRRCTTCGCSRISPGAAPDLPAVSWPSSLLVQRFITGARKDRFVPEE